MVAAFTQTTAEGEETSSEEDSPMMESNSESEIDDDHFCVPFLLMLLSLNMTVTDHMKLMLGLSAPVVYLCFFPLYL